MVLGDVKRPTGPTGSARQGMQGKRGNERRG